MSHYEAKSRLGSLLKRKGLITQAQLDSALQTQLTSGMRLGEVLIEQGILTERQLTRALKKQSRHRFVAGIMAMVLGPFSMGAMANSQPTEQTQNSVISSADLMQYKGLKALDNDGLAQVAGQGISHPEDALNLLLARAQGNDPEAQSELDKLGAVGELAQILNPIASLLDADVTVKGVKYNNDTIKQSVNEDGSIELGLPSEIEEIAFRNMRVAGTSGGGSLGDIVISNVQFSDQSSIRIRPHQ